MEFKTTEELMKMTTKELVSYLLGHGLNCEEIPKEIKVSPQWTRELRVKLKKRYYEHKGGLN